ncbi:MAG: VWA domain-containing protein [Planctomycetota bacterium]
MKQSSRNAFAACVLLAALLAGHAFAGDGELSNDDWRKAEKELDAAVSAHDARRAAAAAARVVEDQSVRALLVIEKALAEWDRDPTGIVRALRKLASDAKVKKEIVKDVTSLRPPRVRASLIATLSGDDAEALPALERALIEDNEEVSVAAVLAIAHAGDAAVEPLVQRMERCEAQKGPIWEECRHALTDLLGMKLDSAAELRARWMDWKEKGGTAAARAQAKEAKRAAGAGPRTVDLFGREITCSRVVFVLDVSASMLAVDDPNLEVPSDNKTKGKGDAKTGTAGGADPRSRIERAKRELVKVLKALPRTTKVNLIAFSSGTKYWRPGTPPELHALTDPARDEAVAWVEALTAHGATATDEALARAFDVEGARCIYLLSDGVPARRDNSRIPTKTILDLINDRNGVRKLHVHTLGFVGADRDFMKAVAKTGGGEYSDIK